MDHNHYEVTVQGTPYCRSETKTGPKRVSILQGGPHTATIEKTIADFDGRRIPNTRWWSIAQASHKNNQQQARGSIAQASPEAKKKTKKKGKIGAPNPGRPIGKPNLQVIQPDLTNIDLCIQSFKWVNQLPAFTGWANGRLHTVTMPNPNSYKTYMDAHKKVSLMYYPTSGKFCLGKKWNEKGGIYHNQLIELTQLDPM